MSRIRESSLITKERYLVKNRLHGLFRGVVEDNFDPERRGRVRVRVPEVDGTEKSMEADELRWAEPIHSYGGINDSGSLIIPTIGATVWILYEQEDPQYPTYFGAWYKTPVKQRELNTHTTPITLLTYPELGDPRGGTWRQPVGPEIPVEARRTQYYDPTVQILYKSPKGATIIMEERDGNEYFRLFDRLGQVISFDGPVTIENNQGSQVKSGGDPTEWVGTEGLRRGDKSALEGTEIGTDKVVGQTAMLRMLGLQGQGIEIVASPGGNRVKVTSKDPENEDEVSILLGAGIGVMEISGVSEDVETFRLSVNTRTGSVEMIGTTSIKFKAPEVSIEADRVALSGSARLQGDLVVQGDVIVAGEIVGGYR